MHLEDGHDGRDGVDPDEDEEVGEAVEHGGHGRELEAVGGLVRRHELDQLIGDAADLQ